jgi:hypothetical protein
MSFRDRHRYLDAAYNSYPDPDSISAKKLESVSRRAGLLMEEVLSWFEDEKSRRSKLFGTKTSQSNGLPLSPESDAENTVTPNISRPADPLPEKILPQIDDIFSPPEIPAGIPEKTNSVIPSKAKRGRLAKSHPPIPLGSPLPEAKRQKYSQYVLFYKSFYSTLLQDFETYQLE